MEPFEKEAAKDWNLKGYGRPPEPVDQRLDQPMQQARPKPPVTVPSTPSPWNTDTPIDERYFGAQEAKVAIQNALKSHTPPIFPQGSKQSRAKQDPSPGKIKYFSRQQPDAIVNEDDLLKPSQRISIEHKQHKRPRSSRASLYAKIGEQTGTWIKTSQSDPQHICIWGDPSGVAEAKQLLRKQLSKPVTAFYHSPFKKPIRLSRHSLPALLPTGPHPTAQKPFGPPPIQPIQPKGTSESILELRKEPRNTKASYKLMFYWPKDGPTLRATFGEELERLDGLRQQLGCHIFVTDDLKDFLCVSSDQHISLEKIARLLQGEWKNAFAKSDTRVKAYLLEPPRNMEAAERVAVQHQKGNEKTIPSPYGKDPEHNPKEKAQQGLIELQNKNRRLLRDSLHKCLGLIQYTKGNMRMRVKFGTFVLEKFRKIGKEASVYRFGEFADMILDDRCQGHLVPGLEIRPEILLKRCIDSPNFLELKGGNLASLKSIPTTQSASFEFLGKKNTPATIRLEINFGDGSTGAELSAGHTQWLTIPANREAAAQRLPMQLCRVDFDRCDWQVGIEFFDILEEDKISPEQRYFAETVKQEPGRREESLTSTPGRRISFIDHVPISRFIQKSAVQLQVKGTNYVLELARYEEFTRSPDFGNRWFAPKVCWGATLYNPEWDQALGRKDEQRSGGLQKFFPPLKGKSREWDDSGYQEFLRVVRATATMLGIGGDPNSGYGPGMLRILTGDLGTFF